MSLRSGKTYDLLGLVSRGVAAEDFTSIIDVSGYTEANVLLRVTDDGGTDPTITLTLWTQSIDGDGLWYKISTIVNALAVTTASATDILNAYGITNFGRKIRIGYVVGGTNTPLATFSVQLVAKT